MIGTLRPKFVYRVFRAAEWRAMTSAGYFLGSAIDSRDGYIHLSSRGQVLETIERHFDGDTNVLVVEIETLCLGEKLRWEPSRGGVLFPHLYGTLAMTSVVRTIDAGTFARELDDSARDAQ